MRPNSIGRAALGQSGVVEGELRATLRDTEARSTCDSCNFNQIYSQSLRYYGEMTESGLSREARVAQVDAQRDPQTLSQSEVKALAGTKPFVFNAQHYKKWESSLQNWWTIISITEGAKRTLYEYMFLSPIIS